MSGRLATVHENGSIYLEEANKTEVISGLLQGRKSMGFEGQEGNPIAPFSAMGYSMVVETKLFPNKEEGESHGDIPYRTLARDAAWHLFP